ncbi:TetR/AcrR family transcriptional regulator [Nocardia sp. CC227C]|uniref:TetR/AcrR family transcriptional regulator n=1 Tax=Nocardia sp. CC227C TaxID=3044562 RepID=UPI00278BF363|nr:TetR/AcrR family transcriptional regulator [Nocardia sp. CC227C]
MTKRAYHHGDLRAALLRAAAEQIAQDGVDAVSLRALAQRAGVSHAAPAHHFGNKQGLLTELAVEGFELLAAELAGAAGDFRAVALAYIGFARRWPGHFDVMFRRDLLCVDDARLIAARSRSGAELRSGIAELGLEPEGRRAGRLAAWSLVHGFAHLWREGALVGSELDGDDPEALALAMVSAVRFESGHAD